MSREEHSVVTEPKARRWVLKSAKNGDWTMTSKTILSAAAVLLSLTTVSLAQSLPNYGPNAPATGDSFGKPYSGAQPLRSGSRAYVYQWRSRHHFHRHRHYTSGY
jgi:hypothetical protein